MSPCYTINKELGRSLNPDRVSGEMYSATLLEVLNETLNTMERSMLLTQLTNKERMKMLFLFVSLSEVKVSHWRGLFSSFLLLRMSGTLLMRKTRMSEAELMGTFRPSPRKQLRLSLHGQQ